MKIIDAFWEKRNLGVSCVEVTVNTDDGPEIAERLDKLVAEYIVVKVPSKKIDLMFMLEDKGYHFIETQLAVSHNLKGIDNINSGIIARVVSELQYSEMTSEDLTELFLQIRSEVFESDRVYLDPEFTHEQASNRYIGWITDEKKRGATLYKVTFEGRSIGFFSLYNDKENICHASVSCVYKGYENSGMGLGVYYYMVVEAKKRGSKSMSGAGVAVSTNNVRSLKALIAVGFQVKNAFYVYVKHGKK
ncbi:hypothetical protein FACS189496_2640 [Bacilli bacterium]|nr:hypothetical protein FACS189496_2640 [Bacilli bacterium]